MHRSGTSAVSRILNLMGCYFGSEEMSVGVGQDNPKGFWERKDVVETNDFILEKAGATWSDISAFDNARITADDEVLINQKIQNTIIKLDAHRPWFIKDPRLCLTLRWWLTHLETPVFIFAYRHPLESAESLEKRNGFSKEYGLKLWEIYSLEMLNGMKGRKYLIVDYEDIINKPLDTIKNLHNKLSETNGYSLRLPIEKEIVSFIDPNLKHHTKKNTYQHLSSDQIRLLNYLIEGAGDYDIKRERIRAYEEMRIMNSKMYMAQNGERLLHEEKDKEISKYITQLENRILEKDNRTKELCFRVYELEKKLDDNEKELEKLSQENISIENKLEKKQRIVKDLNKETEIMETHLEETLTNLKDYTADLEISLTDILNSKIARMVWSVYRYTGMGNRGLSAKFNRAQLLMNSRKRIVDSFEREHNLSEKQKSKIELSKFLLVNALKKPRTTLKLITPKRILNGIKALLFEKGNIEQLHDRYKSIYGENSDSSGRDRLLESSKLNWKGDILFFPVIDWDFRTQRPQHLAIQLAKQGYRVFYFTTTPYQEKGESFQLLKCPSDNVFVCQLASSFPPQNNMYKEKMSIVLRNQYIKSLKSLMEFANIKSTISILNHYYWKPLVDIIPGTTMGYDCMDHHVGFHENTKAIPLAEMELIEDADFVITSSQYLYDNISKIRETTLIRNGCDFSFLHNTQDVEVPENTVTRVGYIGAIAEWFDAELVIEAAKLLPEWEFWLIGSTVGSNINKLKKPSNIKLIGEIPYSEVPKYLHSFDVCIIPFKIIELTKATNPVKVYEYLSAGKPVVSTALPEVKLLDRFVYVAHNSTEFVQKLKEADANKNNKELIQQWTEWAQSQDWSERALEVEKLFTSNSIKVSIIIVTYNNLELTKACFDSVDKYTRHNDYEVIIVDNASKDGSRDFIESYVSTRDHWKCILNDENYGFATGNNIGIEESIGEVVILLNNDTYVTPGWLKRLTKALYEKQEIGLVGPVTNNIGNEAKIDISYTTMEEMLIKAEQYTRKKSRQRLEVDNVAFFCVAIKREVIEKIGLLDEQFGLGFFEDDDFCKRVLESQYKIAIIEDCFIHHHLSASFDKMGSDEKNALFQRNKVLFEKKWGEWLPHKHRN